MASTKWISVLLTVLFVPSDAQKLRGVDKEDVETSLSHELEARKVADEQVLAFKKAVEPTFKALPKNQDGQLDHQTVRYILHRLFVQRYGWHIKGLEPGGDVWGEYGAEKKGAWVPEFLVEEFEKRFEDEGIDLNDLAVLGATLEDVARKEVAATVSNIFASLNISENATLDADAVQSVVDTYLVLFLGDGKWSLMPNVVANFAEKHTYFKPTQTWVRGVEKPHVTKPDGTPEEAVGMQKVLNIAEEIGEKYGHYNDVECSKLKTMMLKMWDKGHSTGRVRLSDFYALGFESEWNLNEKADYLRTIGALDETNVGMPLVIVPNYITARPNCLQSTQLYAVCCRNECEDLMGEVERNLAAPTATPERIIQVVGVLRSSTTGAPIEITEEMRSRLDDMAILHGSDGKVHIHGRLFAQWMHHAFPTECPFPHVSGRSDPVTPDEWLNEDTVASEEERREHVDTASDLLTAEGADIVMPWEQKEELLGAKHINLTDAANSLAFELSGERKERLKEFRAMLEPTYAAWPKDDAGFLEHQTARYVLHRLFVQRHSWVIKGLEPNGDAYHAHGTESSFKDWVPEYMLHLMEERVGRRGLDLNDLAALAAAIEDLIHKEAEGTLGEIYTALQFGNATDRAQVHKALSAYMVVYLGNGVWSLDAAISEEFQQKHNYWNATEAWFRGIEEKQLGTAEGPVTFATVAGITKDIGARYGAYNDDECQKLKVALMNTWGKGKATGRVRLVDFYRLGLDTEWSLTEKASYLKALGALDDTNASAPMVMIPNYLAAKPNCLQSTSLYSICCRNECEELMGKLEKSLAAPTAAPQHIVSLVQALTSPSVEAPRELPQSLVGRLQEVAILHGGEVNLHGRLFAQWMHHAFPSECPYPHEAGTSDPVSPDAWTNQDFEASEEERRKHVDADSCGPEQAAAEWTVELPWSEQEELLSSVAASKLQHRATSAPGSWATTFMEVLLLVGAIGACLALLLAPEMKRQEVLAFAKYHSKPLSLGALMVFAFAFDLVSRPLLVFIVGTGLVLRRLTTSCGMPLNEKEKCMV